MLLERAFHEFSILNRYTVDLGIKRNELTLDRGKALLVFLIGFSQTTFDLDLGFSETTLDLDLEIRETFVDARETLSLIRIKTREVRLIGFTKRSAELRIDGIQPAHQILNHLIAKAIVNDF
ncbi:MAG TPA: hypothetical protein VJR92_07335 [Gemmatimonadaceae bacterium]|nr:hypothetical protein [Gemmatimonadaceae bacterium]